MKVLVLLFVLTGGLGAETAEVPVPRPAVPGDRVVDGFWLYRDRWEGGSHAAASANGGVIDMFQTDRPHGGAFSIGWTDVGRYGLVGWFFAPSKDLTAVVDEASVSFWIRTSALRFSFDVRLVDAQGPGSDDLPCRMSATIDQTQIPHDGQWHHVEIPLSDLKLTSPWNSLRHGSPPREFRWNQVAGLELVAEQGPLTGVTLQFDDVSVEVEKGSGECP